MAIQRWEHEAMNSRIVPDDVGNYVLYTDHLAECREREIAAFVEGAKWQSYRMGDEVRMMEEARAKYGDD